MGGRAPETADAGPGSRDKETDGHSVFSPRMRVASREGLRVWDVKEEQSRVRVPSVPRAGSRSACNGEVLGGVVSPREFLVLLTLLCLQAGGELAGSRIRP